MKLSKEEFIKILENRSKSLEIILDTNQLEQIYLYKELIIEWNEKINLTSIIEDDEIIEKHMIDSLNIVKEIKENTNIIDVGTGAGFPGILIAIYFKGNVKITLLDALNKRVIFLNEVIKKLNLNNIEVIHGRSEEISHDIKFREKYDVVVSRAVAALNILTELTIPLIKVKGKAIYMKAEKTEEEIAAAKKAISKLNCCIEKVVIYNIKQNCENISHTLVILDKIKNNDIKYPRQFTKIKKQPL